MSNVKHKKLTSKAGITIPKDIRLNAGFTGGMAVDIVETDEGILIRKHRPTCKYCGSIESVGTFKCDEVCAPCATNIYKEVAEKHAI